MKRRLGRLATQQTGLFLAVLIVTVGLLGYRLGTLVGSLRGTELSIISTHQAVHEIVHTPVYLPWQLSRLLIANLAHMSHQPGLIYDRAPSVVIGIITALLLYWLLKKWYGYRLAVFGTLLAITAPWFLHSARLANQSISYSFAMTVLLCLAAQWHQRERSKLLLYISALAVAVCLYVPGFVWLTLGCIVFERKHIIASLKASKLHAFGAGLVGLIAIVPFVYSIVKLHALYRTFLAVPVEWPTPVVFAERVADCWRYLFIGGWQDATYTLVGLPVVDVLTTLAFVVGLYLYSKHLKATRTRLLLYLAIVGTVIVAFHGLSSIYLLLPIIVVLSTGGIGYLLHLWLRVFPRNPIARGFGIALMGIVILFAVAYNLRNYYEAWPHNASTQAAFQAKQ